MVLSDDFENLLEDGASPPYRAEHGASHHRTFPEETGNGICHETVVTH